MILFYLIVVLLAGGVLSWIAGLWRKELSRWISLLALTADLIVVVAYWIRHPGPLLADNQWLAEVKWTWIPRFGIGIHLGWDGLSLMMVALSLLLGSLSVLSSWSQIKHRVNFFHFNILWITAGIIGVFISLDLFLFYFFWEMMLVPMYFLIGIWGHKNRIYASFKFFLFTQASGIFMLVSILGLYFIQGQSSGVYSFDYMHLIGVPLSPMKSFLLMIGFMFAFFVKLPAIPFHTWLPSAHTEAPTAGSVILAGLMLKTGAYGILRFVLPLFPDSAHAFAPVAMLLGVAGILYGAKLAFAQNDLKKLVAYTSISHMGFVLLGAFSANALALQGVVLQMICHGISTGALFILVGVIDERIKTRELSQMGGLWASVPKMGAAGMLFAMASVGLPGLGNFVAEFLILLGTFKVHPLMAVLASLGLIASTIYALWMVQKVFHGKSKRSRKIRDFNPREILVMAVLGLIIIWLGVYPQPVLDTAGSSLAGILSRPETIKSPAPSNYPRDQSLAIPIAEKGFGTQVSGHKEAISSLAFFERVDGLEQSKKSNLAAARKRERECTE
jgi:NADH-quinone oxidoreductase subunit M